MPAPALPCPLAAGGQAGQRRLRRPQAVRKGGLERATSRRTAIELSEFLLSRVGNACVAAGASVFPADRCSVFCSSPWPQLLLPFDDYCRQRAEGGFGLLGTHPGGCLRAVLPCGECSHGLPWRAVLRRASLLVHMRLSCHTHRSPPAHTIPLNCSFGPGSSLQTLPSQQWRLRPAQQQQLPLPQPQQPRRRRRRRREWREWMRMRRLRFCPPCWAWRRPASARRARRRWAGVGYLVMHSKQQECRSELAVRSSLMGHCRDVA